MSQRKKLEFQFRYKKAMKEKFTLLLIDDERLARERMKTLITEFSDQLTLIGEADNGLDAEKMIVAKKPDVIFLDIEMPELNGFELLKRLAKIPIVVFCTAYEEYALKAFETNSIDYLVKPIKPERLRQTLMKIDQFKTHFHQEKMLEVVRDIQEQKTKRTVTSIPVKKGDTTIFIKLEEILYFKANDKYVTVYTVGGEELIEQSLTKLEEKLPSNFLRIRRGLLVNTNFVNQIQKYFNSRFVISLEPTNTKLISGRSYKEKIKNYINQ